MSNESNQPRTKPSPVPSADELKASDFFPPGVGWNQPEPSELETDEQRKRDADAARGKH